MCSMVGSVLNAINGAAYYCTSSTSHSGAFGSSAEVVTFYS